MQRKAPLPGRIFARCILQRRFAGRFGCMARISRQSQLVSDAWRANLAANWRFSRPKPPRRCMRRKNCHGLPPGNAPRRNIATASQAKGASGRNPATVGRWGTHFASVLPSSSARERTAAESCHDRTPTPNAPRAHAPWLPLGPRPWLRAPPLSTPPGIPTPLNCGCCRRFGRWRWYNPLIVALLPSGS